MRGATRGWQPGRPAVYNGPGNTDWHDNGRMAASGHGTQQTVGSVDPTYDWRDDVGMAAPRRSSGQASGHGTPGTWLWRRLAAGETDP